MSLINKKLVTGNCFIVSMSMQGAILISFYGVITRVLVKSIIEKLCKGYDYKISDLFKKIINKFKCKPVKSNTYSPSSSGVVRAGAEMSTVAVAVTNGINIRGLSQYDHNHPPQLMTPIDTSDNLPVVYVQFVGQHHNVPLRPLTEAERDAMAGLSPTSLTDNQIRLRNDFLNLDRHVGYQISHLNLSIEDRDRELTSQINNLNNPARDSLVNLINGLNNGSSINPIWGSIHNPIKDLLNSYGLNNTTQDPYSMLSSSKSGILQS